MPSAPPSSKKSASESPAARRARLAAKGRVPEAAPAEKPAATKLVEEARGPKSSGRAVEVGVDEAIELVGNALAQVNGDKKQAAKLLGITVAQIDGVLVEMKRRQKNEEMLKKAVAKAEGAGAAVEKRQKEKVAEARAKTEEEGPSSSAYLRQAQADARLPPVDSSRVRRAIAAHDEEKLAERARRATTNDPLEALPTSRFLEGVVGAAGTPSSRAPGSYARARDLGNVPMPAHIAELVDEQIKKNSSRPRSHVNAPPSTLPGPTPSSILRRFEVAPSSLMRAPAPVRAGVNAPTLASPAQRRVPAPVRTYRRAADACTIDVVKSAIERHDGNKTAAARELGLTPAGLYKILHRGGWSIPDAERAKHQAAGRAAAKTRWG